jgi:hypothetical protein
MHRFLIGLISILICGCHGPSTQVLMSFDRATGLYAAPFPSNDLRRSDGSINVDRFPNPNNVDLINQGLTLIRSDKQGFATSGAVYFQLSAALDSKQLPDLNGSVTPGANVFLMSVDSTAPDFLKRYPVQVTFTADGGPFGAPNLLAVLPLQGIPLRPGTLYAAVVRRRALDAHGNQLLPSPTMKQLAANLRPPALPDAAFADYTAAIGALASAGVAATDLAGLAVFTTGAPAAAMGALRTDILSRPLPAMNLAPVRTDTFPDYCVYATTIDMPDYQSGTPPFSSAGGGWKFDANGKPIFQRNETANLVFTVPRTAMPAGGFPLAVLVQAGAGGDRALVDRGVQAMTGGPALTPGTGPAMYFAKAGYAGAEVDGPLEGLRNTTHDNEDFLIFNFMNAEALRDNVRESALELILFAHIVPTIQFDASDCPGFTGGPVKFEIDHLALMGHSMGATIAPLIISYEPLYRAVVLSGSGGSYIENVMYKIKPLRILPLAEALLDYDMDGRSLTDTDPALTLVQWAAEPSDPPVYNARIVHEPAAGDRPRHVLMEQGIVDHYIMPNIANATTLSMGLDVGGTPLDQSTPELSTQMAILPLLPFSGRAQISLPAQGNVTASDGSRVTALVIQHPSDGIEDGHEIVFQTDPPKHQYRCFLQCFLTGTPKVPTDGAADDPCP